MASSLNQFDMSYTGNRGVMGSKIAGWNARLTGSAMGRALKTGTMESFGFYSSGGVSQGFMGLGPTYDSFKSQTSQFAGTTARSKFTSGIKVASRMARKSGLKGTLVGIGKTLAKSFGLATTAYFAYEGYQKEGVWGATKEVATGVASQTAFAGASAVAAGLSVGAVATIGAAAVAVPAAIAGYYMLGEAGIAHAKGLRELEMGGGDLMQQTVNSASTATARQRSLLALNNTHINGRMALGNEGFLLHRGFSM